MIVVKGRWDEILAAMEEGGKRSVRPTMAISTRGTSARPGVEGRAAVTVVSISSIRPVRPSEDLRNTRGPREGFEYLRSGRRLSLLSRRRRDLSSDTDLRRSPRPQDRLCGKSGLALPGRGDHRPQALQHRPADSHSSREGAQQVLIIERMAATRLGVEVVTCPLVREPTAGPELRNAYCRRRKEGALILSISLRWAERRSGRGEDAPRCRRHPVSDRTEPLARVDYVEAVDPLASNRSPRSARRPHRPGRYHRLDRLIDKSASLLREPT